MRTCALTIEEQTALEQYRVSFTTEAPTQFTIKIDDLFQKDKLADYLSIVQKELQAPSLMSAASAFSKRYSYLVVVPALYAFSSWNKQLNMVGENLSLLSPESDEKWLPRLLLKERDASLLETKEERELARNQLIETVFARHLSPLWDNLSAVTKIPKHILWENTAIYLYWLYESLLEKEELSPKVRDNIQLDYDYILHEAKAPLFGYFDNESPFLAYYGEKQKVNGKALRIRKTCCFYYEISEEKAMCTICPKHVANGC